MEQTTFAQTEGKRFSCPGCGGGLRYDIASEKMKCDHCGGFSEVEALPSGSSKDDTMEVAEFRCPQCGAAVYSSETSVTSFCSFCGSDVVLTAKLARTKRPSLIVPFRVTREQCEESFRRHLGSFRLVPEAFKSAETISHFRAVYVPFWSYRVHAEGPIQLKGTKSYTRGKTRYDETYDLTVDAAVDQRRILYDASTVFEDETAAMLRHTADNAKVFREAYLSGFYAQAADVPPEAYYREAAATAVRIFLEKFKSESGMDTIECKEKAGFFGLPEPAFSQELVMLPVWLLAHRQGDRVVYTAVNGCTGEVVCDVPVGLGRVAGVAVTLGIAIFALLYMFLTLKPGPLLAICAVLALITQYRFSAMHRLIYNRKTRAYEPDFENGQRVYIGPAQMLLGVNRTTGDKVKDSLGVLAKTLLPVAGVILVTVGARGFVRIISSLRDINFDMVRAVGTFAPLTTFVVTVMMLIHIARRAAKPDGGPWQPGLVSFLACAAGMLCLLTGQVEDILYYACAAAMLLAAIWELILVIRAHNEYASRPVPYFDGKEARQ